VQEPGEAQRAGWRIQRQCLLVGHRALDLGCNHIEAAAAALGALVGAHNRGRCGSIRYRCHAETPGQQRFPRSRSVGGQAELFGHAKTVNTLTPDDKSP
jgi:hypothetical protein